VAYLAKPIDLQELLACVRVAIERYRTYRAVSRTQQRLQDWRQDLQDVEKLMRETPRDSSLAPVLTFVALTLRNLVGCLSDLKNITQALAQQSAKQDACHLLNCPRPAMLTQALEETVQVLEKTKNAFKSKDLGDLRKKLESLLKGAAT
jgi:YesN/AraC family two-component response regulator